MTNGGGISLASGFQLRLASGTLANSDYINLNAATVAGSGLLDNAGGVVTGPGTIIAPFLNSGELVVPPGPTNVTQPFASTGAIVLGGSRRDPERRIDLQHGLHRRRRARVQPGE